MENYKSKLRLGKVKFDDFPLDINETLHKFWVGKVVNVDLKKKYPIELKWLEKTYLDGVLYYELDTLSVGDYIKVNTCSSDDRYPGYLLVKSINNNFMESVAVNEKEVIGKFIRKDNFIKRKIKNLIDKLDDKYSLENLLCKVEEEVNNKKNYREDDFSENDRN